MKALPPTPEQADWLAFQMAKLNTPERVNPCVRLYGVDPEGRKCKDCSHLYRKQMSKVYIKCDLRENTNGPGTDHRAGWTACARFESKPATKPSKEV